MINPITGMPSNINSETTQREQLAWFAAYDHEPVTQERLPRRATPQEPVNASTAIRPTAPAFTPIQQAASPRQTKPILASNGLLTTFKNNHQESYDDLMRRVKSFSLSGEGLYTSEEVPARPVSLL
jgi:hypothetical protein